MIKYRNQGLYLNNKLDVKSRNGAFMKEGIVLPGRSLLSSNDWEKTEYIFYRLEVENAFFFWTEVSDLITEAKETKNEGRNLLTPNV